MGSWGHPIAIGPQIDSTAMRYARQPPAQEALLSSPWGIPPEVVSDTRVETVFASVADYETVD